MTCRSLQEVQELSPTLSIPCSSVAQVLLDVLRIPVLSDKSPSGVDAYVASDATIFAIHYPI